MNPKLSFEQLKRLRKVLVSYKFFENSIQASKFTAYSYQCKETSLKFFNEHNVPEELKDISELYGFTPRRKLPILNDVSSHKNCSDSTKLTKTNKERKGRGKGKKPSKIMYPVRFEEVQIQNLKDLGGNVSMHIRNAVEQYILSQKLIE